MKKKSKSAPCMSKREYAACAAIYGEKFAQVIRVFIEGGQTFISNDQVAQASGLPLFIVDSILSQMKDMGLIDAT